MAALQLRAGSWRVLFRYNRQQYSFPVGEVSEIEAHQWKAKVEFILMRIKQHLLDVPRGMDIVAFIRHDGKPPPEQTAAPKETSFAEFRDSYLRTFGNGAVEKNTLYTAQIHLNHFAKTLGKPFVMNGLSLNDLQRHVDRRQKHVVGTTIKKEIDTLRSAWNWASRMGIVEGDFPGGGLVYPKGEEKLPFMTWAEIERRIADGGDPKELWECLYLTEPEINEFLDFVQARKAPPWVYPMCVMTAHTGARRSEMLRAERQDVDLAAGVITIREKKRVRGQTTSRRVPMSKRLKEALASLPNAGVRLLGNLTVQAAQQGFMRVVGKRKSTAKSRKARERKEGKSRTKWAVLRGYHVLRHSFISALATRGIDQRIINELAGHTTEAMARRYRHLYPSTKEAAIKLVFG
jgi:integrase